MAANVQDVIMLVGDSLTEGGWAQGGFAQLLAGRSQTFGGTRVSDCGSQKDTCESSMLSTVASGVIKRTGQFRFASR
jgi:hypothetical protein